MFYLKHINAINDKNFLIINEYASDFAPKTRLSVLGGAKVLIKRALRRKFAYRPQN